jgi:hypothetical protein
MIRNLNVDTVLGRAEFVGILMLTLEELHVKHAVQRAILVQTHHLL